MDPIVTIGASILGSIVVVATAGWRLSSTISRQSTTLDHVQKDIAEIKNDLRSFNSECGQIRGDISTLQTNAHSRLSVIEGNLGIKRSR